MHAGPDLTPYRKPGRFLLVEDSEAGAELMRIAFAERLAETELDVVDHGDAALERLARDELPDVVLLDLNLPGLTGHDVLATIRASADARVRRLPVVVLSHSDADADVQRSYDLGANSHVAKPHSLDALFAVVEAIGRYWLGVASLPR
jgi:two-component system, chemotaxis family, response regulator Rcp1